IFSRRWAVAQYSSPSSPNHRPEAQGSSIQVENRAGRLDPAERLARLCRAQYHLGTGQTVRSVKSRIAPDAGSILPFVRGQRMTAENFDQVLEGLRELKPFRMFTVELRSGQRFEVDHPAALVIRDGVAVFLAPGGIPIWFDHESVSQIIGAPASTSI